MGDDGLMVSPHESLISMVVAGVTGRPGSIPGSDFFCFFGGNRLFACAGLPVACSRDLDRWVYTYWCL